MLISLLLEHRSSDTKLYVLYSVFSRWDCCRNFVVSRKRLMAEHDRWESARLWPLFSPTDLFPQERQLSDTFQNLRRIRSDTYFRESLSVSERRDSPLSETYLLMFIGQLVNFLHRFKESHQFTYT